MSQTLGEKLRQAREAKGITVAEVAEQTRISPHYIESIERDDYKPLPGGIFNKGFVKSFAKYVNIDEQQALEDYSSLVLAAQPDEEPEPRNYRPQVLTDDNSGRSMVPTVIIAVVILALMTAGILFGLNYLQNRPAVQSNIAANTNTNSALQANSNSASPVAAVPDMASVKVEFKAVSSDVSLYAVKDSAKPTTTLVKLGETVAFDPKDNLKLSYSRSLASSVQLMINGKTIAPPAQPTAKRNIIEIEINKENLAQIWQRGTVAPDSVAETALPPTATPAVIRTPPAPRPTAPLANAPESNSPKAVVKPTPTPKVPAAAPTANKPKTQ